MIRTATIKETGERLKVYLLNSTNTWYDYEGMGDNLPPTASKANKKEFKKEELIFDKTHQ